ncbi:eCIS core domain-containing protein [Streptomyces klenkii]|uniref:eCIS core domain-containing protein n=1 Tax=Streptomyces klenkii TaxID=1420899 RepID=UPI0034258768
MGLRAMTTHARAPGPERRAVTCTLRPATARCACRGCRTAGTADGTCLRSGSQRPTTAYQGGTTAETVGNDFSRVKVHGENPGAHPGMFTPVRHGGGARQLLSGPSPGARPSSYVSAPPAIADTLASGGRPLDPVTRSRMEKAFSHDFGGVRIHDGAHAEESARSLGALAYTVGSDVVFGAARYRPGSREGERVLAHELAHVIQQHTAPALAGAPRVVVADSLEREAHAAASAVSGGRQTRVLGRMTHAVQLQQPPQFTIGDLGEQYLAQALDRKGYIVFHDWSKFVNNRGIDLVVWDPSSKQVWLMDNKAWTRGIDDAPALTGSQFEWNLQQVKAFLKSNWASKEAAVALRALEANQYLKVVSNFNAMGHTRFTPKLFSSGVAVFDVRMMRLFTDHVQWIAAFRLLKVQRGVRLTGARGAATVGDMLFVVAVMAGAVFLYRSEGARQVAGQVVAQAALDGLLIRIAGRAVGTIASFSLGLRSDEPESVIERREQIDRIIAALPEIHYDELPESEQQEVRKAIGELVDRPMELPPPPPRTYPVAPAPGLARPQTNPPPPPSAAPRPQG